MSGRPVGKSTSLSTTSSSAAAALDNREETSMEELATNNIAYLESVIQRLERLLAHKRSVANNTLLASVTPSASTGTSGGDKQALLEAKLAQILKLQEEQAAVTKARAAQISSSSSTSVASTATNNNNNNIATSNAADVSLDTSSSKKKKKMRRAVTQMQLSNSSSNQSTSSSLGVSSTNTPSQKSPRVPEIVPALVVPSADITDAVDVDDVAVQVAVGVKPNTSLSPRSAALASSSTIDHDDAANVNQPIERTPSQMRAVFQRVAGGVDPENPDHLIVKVVFKHVTKAVSVQRLSTVGELLHDACVLFARAFPDDIEAERLDLWAPPPAGPVWVDREAVVNDSAVVRCVRDDVALALGSMFEKPEGPDWGQDSPGHRAAQLASPRDRAKKLIETMSRRSIGVQGTASSRGSSPKLASRELSRSDNPALTAKNGDGDSNENSQEDSDDLPKSRRRALSKSDKKSATRLERSVSRPMEVKRSDTSSQLEMERSGASMGMSEIRGHVFININAAEDTTRWHKCWLVGNDTNLEYHYVEDNFTRIKEDIDVAGARELVAKARIHCSEDSVLNQRVDELSAVLDQTCDKLVATPESNYTERKRLLALQRNVTSELKTVCRDAIKRNDTSAPSDLANSAHYKRDLDTNTRQFKVIPINAVRRVEFKPSPTADFDFCLHIAHSRRTGSVIMKQRNSVILSDATKIEDSPPPATPTPGSKLRNTEVPTQDDSESGEGEGETLAETASVDNGNEEAGGVLVGRASVADEYTVPFYVRADNRQNRMMWIWGLDIMFSRRDIGSLPRSSLSRVVIVYEIYLTEKQYVMRLDELIVQWMLPLVNSKTLTESESAHIFGNLERLLEANQRVLSAMTTRFEQEMWDAERSVIGDVWLEAMPSLAIYKAYSVTFVSANAAIKRLLRDNKTFREFHDARPGVLGSALIAPVQRVPRYMLLFKDLLDKTPPNHPDFPLITQCVERITTLANDVNKSVRDHESRSGIAEISQQLIDLPPDLLNRAGIVFVRQGIVRRATTRRTVTTLLLLFNEFLVYAQHDLVGVGSLWRFKGVIQLPYTWLRNLNDTDNVKNAFHLVTPRKTYLMIAKTDSDKALWMRDLSGVIDAYLDRNPQFNESRDVAKIQMRKKTGLWRLLTKDLAAEIEMAEKSREAESARELQPLHLTTAPASSEGASSSSSPAPTPSAPAVTTPVVAPPSPAPSSSPSTPQNASPVIPRAADLGASPVTLASQLHKTSDRHRSVLVAGELDFSQLRRSVGWRQRVVNHNSGQQQSSPSDGGSSIEDEDERLYLVKYLAPLDRFLVRRVEPLLSSLACNAAFVLVLDRICVWHGDESSEDDHRRALQLARAIASTAPSQAGGGDDLLERHSSVRSSPPQRRRRIADPHTFLPALTALDPDAPIGDANNVKVTRRIDELRLFDFAQNVKLFKIRDIGNGDESGAASSLASTTSGGGDLLNDAMAHQIEVALVDTDAISRQHLDSHHMFVLDADSMTFVWAGAKANDTERIWAMMKAEQLQQSRSKLGDIEWIDDGSESALFVAQFASWPLYDDDDEDMVTRMLGRDLRSDDDDVNVSEDVRRSMRRRRESGDDASFASVISAD